MFFLICKPHFLDILLVPLSLLSLSFGTREFPPRGPLTPSPPPPFRSVVLRLLRAQLQGYAIKAPLCACFRFESLVPRSPGSSLLRRFSCIPGPCELFERLPPTRRKEGQRHTEQEEEEEEGGCRGGQKSDCTDQWVNRRIITIRNYPPTAPFN